MLRVASVIGTGSCALTKLKSFSSNLRVDKNDMIGVSVCLNERVIFYYNKKTNKQTKTKKQLTK